jgi:phospholipid/cholesterol/gamma-HCH transport system substrate-binding protein
MKKLYISVGLVVVVAIVVLIFGVFFLNDKDPRETFHTYYLKFRQVSTLAQDDPVKVNGVKLGKVESMNLEGNQVLVRIRLRTDVQVPHGSEFRVQNIGLLGERQIGVLLTDSASYFSPGDTIQGFFDSGIAEVMGAAGEVLDSAKVVMQAVKEVLDSTVATDDFRNTFRRLLVKTEQLEDQVAVMLQETDPALKRTLKGLETATVKVNGLIDENREPLKHLVGDAQGLVKDAGGLVANADTIPGQLLALTGQLQSKDNTLGILLNERKLHDDLATTVHNADSLFQTILKDGLDVNIDFF